MDKRIPLLLVVLVIVSLACGLPKPAEPTATPLPPPPTAIPTTPPTEAPAIPPTATPLPTQPSDSTQLPADEPVLQSEAFYTEEFDVAPPNWSYFHTMGDEDYYDFYTEDGKLVVEIRAENTYTYMAYDDYTYEDVVIEIEAENRGANTNNIGIICRATEDGWYEFNVNSSGMYYIWLYNGSYTLLRSGGSTSIRQGKDTNTVTAMCNGDKLALFINGNDIWNLSDKEFREGQVGVSVSSEYYIPVNVEFERVTISEP